jgi:hypothetical protein
MAWRKWFVRGVVLTVVSCCAAGAYIYQQWTNPAAVREQVLANLNKIFGGATVHVDSARLTLMGRIQVGEIRLARRDDDRTDAIQVPSAFIYHDKEKLLEGELSLRKVELFRPRLRAYRNSDGKWNFEGLITQQRLDKTIPTLVIHQGTLILEDRTAAGNISSLEINDISATLINDPLPTLVFEGAATSPLVGKLTVRGSLQRATGELTLSLKTKDTPLAAKLMQRIAPLCPNNSLQGVEIDGRADFDISLRTHPGQTPNLHYDARAAIRKTRVVHPLLPMPVDDLEVDASLADGALSIDRLTGKLGGAEIRARGSSQLPCPDQNFEAFIDIDRLAVSDEVLRKLPEKTLNVVRLFQPRGDVDIRVAMLKREGKWATFEDGREPTITCLPNRLACVFEKFPYPFLDVAGTIDYQLISEKTKFHVTGTADGQPAVVRGTSFGSKENLDFAADFQVAGVSIDERVLAALPPEPQKIARTFHARGKVDALASIRHRPGAATFENSFAVTFRECDIAWEPFPLALSKVSGRLDISANQWQFHGFRAHHGDGVFEFKGRSYPVPGRDKLGVAVDIVGTNISLSDELRKALAPMPSLAKVWDSFAPSGAMDFAATIHRPTDVLEDLDVRVQARHASIEPRFFPLRFDGVMGTVHYHKGRVDVADVSARNGAMRLSAPLGRVDIKSGGGYHADFADIIIQDFVANAAFVKAAPETLGKACEAIKLQDPALLKTRLVVAQSADAGSRPDIYWDAQGWLKDARLNAGVPLDGVTGVVACRGRHNGHKIIGLDGNVLLDRAAMFKQPFTNVQAHFFIDEKAPETLLATLSAPQFGGDITGEIRVDFQKDARFELNLTASQIDLQKFGQQNLGDAAQLEGKAVGRLHLTGTSAGVQTLDGYGSFDVFAGKLYNLPLILDLLKFLGLRWPDRTAFEEVHALFRINGTRVSLRDLKLQGNAISLTGKGDFELDGTNLNVDFYPTWARFEQLLPPALRSAPSTVTKNFLIIEMRGKVTKNSDDLKFNKRPMPMIVDPLVGVRDRVMGVEPRRQASVNSRDEVAPPPGTLRKREDVP